MRWRGHRWPKTFLLLVSVRVCSRDTIPYQSHHLPACLSTSARARTVLVSDKKYPKTGIRKIRYEYNCACLQQEVPKQGGKAGIVQGYFRDISSFLNVAFTSPAFGSGPTRAIAGRVAKKAFSHRTRGVRRGGV